MVLPIQSQLVHTTNTIKIMSLGLSNLSQMITDLGPLLSEAFSDGLDSFETLEKAANGYFESQMKGLESLSPTPDSLNGGSGPKSDRRLMDEALAKAAALGSGGPTNPMLFDQQPIDPGAGIFGMFGRGGVQDTRSDQVKMAQAMSGYSPAPTYNISIEMSGMTDRSDKSKMARDISDLIQAETTRRADFHRSHGRL